MASMLQLNLPGKISLGLGYFRFLTQESTAIEDIARTHIRTHAWK